MDLDDLIHREGEERLRAAEATCDQSRAAHIALADLYRDRIALHSALEGVGPGADLRPLAL